MPLTGNPENGARPLPCGTFPPRRGGTHVRRGHPSGGTPARTPACPCCHCVCISARPGSRSHAINTMVGNRAVKELHVALDAFFRSILPEAPAEKEVHVAGRDMPGLLQTFFTVPGSCQHIRPRG
ncbi:hypothetical protein NITHO_270018 [Nitrolancea hollandica Lb]|uniref:Uncharacterized protein n=1 Tax=Nitrolancea hollandica Lb TaxID=1129897 RepID=I4EGG0_9BACT|nr:hypothetical protein NITHO_270018 [Nitrolancea hollandica Lb]